MAINAFYAPLITTYPGSGRSNLSFICDTTAELPSVNIMDGDTAFCKDTMTPYQRVSGAWVATVGSSTQAAVYRTIMDCTGSHTAGRVAGTYAIGQGDALAISGTGTLYPIDTVYIAAADYPSINTLAPKLRIRAKLYTNDVAPTGNFTFGLYPITRPATSGGAGLCIYTLGTVVTGSNGATFTTPVADGLLTAVSADFALPADGHYCLGVLTTATVAVSAHIHISSKLQLRNA